MSKHVDLQLSLLQYDSSALCVLVKPLWFEFYFRIISKWRKKSYRSKIKAPLCVWLCCKVHCAVLCRWLLFKQWTSLFHCQWPKYSLRPTGVQSYLGQRTHGIGTNSMQVTHVFALVLPPIYLKWEKHYQVTLRTTVSVVWHITVLMQFL